MLIGRGDEVATISDAFAAAGGGTGRALVFVGEPGIGKTRLVDELCRAGAYRNVLCLIGRATLESQAVSLRAWTEALTVGCRGRPFPSDAAVSAYRATLAWLVPEWRLDGWFAPIEPSVVIGEAVVRLLGALTAEPAGAGVIAVALEDLHWADDVTIDVLEYVAEHIGTVPAVVVATCRTEGRGPEVVRRVERSGGHVVRLARLSVHNATAMVAACRPPATVTAESASHASSLEANAEIVAASEGLPLVIEDLVAGEESGVASLRFVDSVRSRVECLDHRARRCVSVAAVIGERVDWRVVTRAVTGDARTGGEALRAAIELDLVVVDDELVRFRHALTRRVVLDDLVPDERSRLSRVAAEALVATGGDDPACDELAAELWARAGAVDESIRVLVALSTRAERTGDVSTAERVCARAVELAQARVGGGVGTESEFVVLGAELARLHLLTGRTNDAIALAGQLLARSEGVDRQRTIGLRVLLARANLMRADWNEADSYLVSVRADSLSASVVAEVALRSRVRVWCRPSRATSGHRASGDQSDHVGRTHRRRRADL